MYDPPTVVYLYVLGVLAVSGLWFSIYINSSGRRLFELPYLQRYGYLIHLPGSSLDSKAHFRFRVFHTTVHIIRARDGGVVHGLYITPRRWVIVVLYCVTKNFIKFFAERMDDGDIVSYRESVCTSFSSTRKLRGLTSLSMYVFHFV